MEEVNKLIYLDKTQRISQDFHQVDVEQATHFSIEPDGDWDAVKYWIKK